MFSKQNQNRENTKMFSKQEIKIQRISIWVSWVNIVISFHWGVCLSSSIRSIEKFCINTSVTHVEFNRWKKQSDLVELTAETRRMKYLILLAGVFAVCQAGGCKYSFEFCCVTISYRLLNYDVVNYPIVLWARLLLHKITKLCVFSLL